jgi:NADPH-dependent 2,4-dienoyl-CoA reductase/sulfur reductase-like enzyme/peroxiredoxin family protein/rhodanese-related sulfurtransferase/TusA-related sulfurtransferase
VLFERGQHISFANCGMPYFIGGAIAQRERLLVQTAEAMRRRFGIDVRTGTEVLRIDRARKEVIVRDLAIGRESAEAYDVLILSPGAAPVRPAIPGADDPRVFTLRNLADMDAIKAAVDVQAAKPIPHGQPAPANAVVVGGGYIGLEMAEALRERGLGVTLVELAGQVFAAVDAEMAGPIHQQLRLHGVDLRLGKSVAGIEPAGGELAVRLSDGAVVAAALVILAVGVKPESGLARAAGLAIGPTGGVLVDEHMRTSDPAIFAVGDVVEVTDFVAGTPAVIPLAGPANRQGRIAADNAFGRPSVYRRSQGTAICKVFDLAVGMTGMSEKALKRAGRPYEKVYVHPTSHASYYPGASQLSLKLLFDPRDGKVLGAQAVGSAGVDKRIDVLAVAVRAGLTVYDLEDMELSYAPPYGSARDPVNYAGFAAGNVLRGDTRLCHAADAASPRGDQFLVDVRTPTEFQAGTIPGAVNVPLDGLRGRLGELPRDKELLVFCQAGLRGYLAGRILTQNGLKARNLSGGYKTYLAATDGGNGGGAAKPGAASPPVAAAPQAAGAASAPAGIPAPKPETKAPPEAPMVRVDACGLACPGPIMLLKTEMERLPAGGRLCMTASDGGFPTDVAAWCRSTGHELLESGPEGKNYRAVIGKPAGAAAETGAALAGQQPVGGKQATLVVFSGDFDRAMAAFIIANGAAAMGARVTMFFTFWGLNVLRRENAPAVQKNLVERMFGWMMPRGAGKLPLSKMHMGGMGLAMIKGIMRKKRVPALGELIASARQAGVRLVACAMSMDLMGIKPEELIDGVESGGVAMYLDSASGGNVNLFV